MASPSRLALHWVFTIAMLAASGCGGAARSATMADGPAPEGEAEPSVLPHDCQGVVGSSGTAGIEVRDQHELDALAACSTIVGDLTIQPFAGVDLRPLASLRTVQGTLTLGSLYDDSPPSGFPSLDGLDNLEGVAALSLRGVMAPSLRALGGLRRFVPFAEQTVTTSKGFLFIDHCPGLTDLGGLERLEGLSGVVLKNNLELTSLRGIQIPEVMNGLEVWDSPLEDLGDVTRLTEIRHTLWFNHTALKSAAGLERVARVDQLQFWGNSALEDLSALSALTQVRYLNVNDNPLLETLPALDGMQSLTGLSVTDNPSLREIPSSPITDLHDAWIERNASLERVLVWSEVTRAYEMRVADNPRLSLLDSSHLQEVTNLWVTNNPALDDSGLRRLESQGPGVVRIAGNLGQTLPLAKCPWTGDGICDEAPNAYGVCAAGTDPDCVAPE